MTKSAPRPQIQPPENTEGEDVSEESLVQTAFQSGQVVLIQIGSIVLGFGFNYCLARFFGAHIVGQFSLVQTIINVCAIFTVFGLNVGLLKYIPEFRSQGRSRELHIVTREAFRFGLLFGAAGTVVLLSMREVIARGVFDNEQLGNLLLWGGVALVPITLVRIADGWYRGFKRAAKFNLYNLVVYKLFLLAAVVGLAVFGFIHARWVIIAYLAACVILAFLLVVEGRNFEVSGRDIFGHLFALTENRGRRAVIRRRLLQYSSTMLMVTVMAFLLGKTDILMIGYFMEPEAVGVYRIALLVGETILLMLTAVNSIFPAFISELYANRRLKELGQMYATTTKWILVASIPMAITLGIFSDVILALFGDAFVGGALALPILVMGFLISAGVGSNGHILRIVGFERVELYNTVAIVVLNIAINVLLIPRYGVEGAAVATAVSIGLVSLVKVVEVEYFLDIFPYKKSFWPLIPSTLIAVGIAVIGKGMMDDLFGVGIVSAINLILFVGATYWFQDETDRKLFERVEIWGRQKFG